MSSKSNKKFTVVSEDTQNTAEANKEMPVTVVVLCGRPGYKMCAKSNGYMLETGEHSHTPSIDYQLNTTLHEVIERCQECVLICQTGKSRPRSLVVQTIDEVIQLLLEKGADFNMKNAFGETPLMLASEKGCCHAIQKLFDWEKKSGLKPDLDARDQYGKTALMKAAEPRHVSIMQLLLRHRISVNLNFPCRFKAEALHWEKCEWTYMHFFCKGLLSRKRDYMGEYRKNLRSRPNGGLSWKVKAWLRETLEFDENTTRFIEERVKLLLAINELYVDATDISEDTLIDLAELSSKLITQVFKSFKDRDAIRNLLEPPLKVARFDERGRGPLHHWLIISHLSYYAIEDVEAAKRDDYHEWFDFMAHGILLKPEDFKESTDDKRRTPLHDAVMPPSYISEYAPNLVSVLLNTGSNTNAVDVYGKTPLHYAERDYQYDELVKYGADESIKDISGHTPVDLRQLRKSVISNKEKAKELKIGRRIIIYTSTGIKRVLSSCHVTELSKANFAETVRIYTKSPRLKESSEETIWNIWIKNDLLGLNKRVSKLKPSIQRFIDRLADGIKEKDGRFECKPTLVGSADEETKVVLSADFDFNFKLVKFSQLCDAFPHPLGPNGYFQLKLKSDSTKWRQSDWKCDCFFDKDQCLLTKEVNSRFQIILEDVLYDHNFWGEEHLFDWNLIDIGSETSEKPRSLCNTVRLRMINPIADGEGGLLFVNVSIDVVACVHLEDSCFEDQLPVEIIPAVKADGCTLVLDGPRFHPSKKPSDESIFCHTYSRISFAPLESRIIRESLSLVKAAYLVCKLILYNNRKTTYQLKTALLFCTEALKIREGCERKEKVKFTLGELSFWVERIMFCFCEFYRHDFFPCYFMPSFKQPVVCISKYYINAQEEDGLPGSEIPFEYSAAFDIYFDVCPDGATMDIPIIQDKHKHDLDERSLIVSQDPDWDQFDREEFIRKLASRCPSY